MILPVVLFWFAATSSSRALTLTGAVNFSTEADGDAATTLPQIWNTRTGDPQANLFLIVGSPTASATDPFFNPEPPTAGPISLSLSPGTYRVLMYANPGADFTGFAGLNLFFESNNATPAISVFAETDTAATWNVNSSANTRALDGGYPVAASGSLSFSDGSLTATLSDYKWYGPAFSDGELPTADRVGPFNSASDSNQDFRGAFTLNVVNVPEPTAMALVGPAFLIWAASRRRRK